MAKTHGAQLADERNDAADAAYNAAIAAGQAEDVAQKAAADAGQDIAAKQILRAKKLRSDVIAAGGTPEEADAAADSAAGTPFIS